MEHDMKLGDDARGFLYRAAGWARFLAIAGFVILGLTLLATVLTAVLSGMTGRIMTEAGTNAELVNVFSVVYLIFCSVMIAICAVPMVYLYCFAGRARRAIADGDTLTLAQSMRSLKNYFVFYGIALIVGLVFSFLSVVMWLLPLSAHQM